MSVQVHDSAGKVAAKLEKERALLDNGDNGVLRQCLEDYSRDQFDTAGGGAREH